MSATTEPAYTVDYFIAKFEAIPEEQWTTGKYTNHRGHCALGFCKERRWRYPTRESKALRGFFKEDDDVAIINDGANPRYPQPTPRARILAALRDIKSSQTTNTKEA